VFVPAEPPMGPRCRCGCPYLRGLVLLDLVLTASPGPGIRLVGPAVRDVAVESLTCEACARETLTGDLPPRRSAWTGGSLADDVHARAFRDQLERVKPAPKVPEWERIATEIRLVAERIAHGEIGVDEAAAELDRRADRLLEKRRWLLSRDGSS